MKKTQETIRRKELAADYALIYLSRFIETNNNVHRGEIVTILQTSINRGRIIPINECHSMKQTYKVNK